MRTHTSECQSITLEVPVGAIRVTAAPAGTATTVTLAPRVEGDTVAADAITRATITETGDRLLVEVPPVAARTQVMNVNGATFMQTGNIISAGTATTIVNGQVISGSSNVIVGQSGGDVVATVSVPTGSAVSLETVSGQIVTTGHLRTVAARTISGAIDIDTADRARARTISGAITISDAGGVDAHSVSGAIFVGRVSEFGSAQSTSGAVRASTATNEFTAESMSGEVVVRQLAGVTLPRSAVRSMSGRVSLR